MKIAEIPEEEFEKLHKNGDGALLFIRSYLEFYYEDGFVEIASKSLMVGKWHPSSALTNMYQSKWVDALKEFSPQLFDKVCVHCALLWAEANPREQKENQ